MKFWKIILIGVIAVCLIFLILNKEESSKQNFQQNTQISEPIKISYENIEEVLSKNPLVRDLPENVVLLLKFYNFNSGKREWERSYIITKGNVKQGEVENPDLTLVIHSKYLNEMTDRNFCSIIQKAKQNGDLGIYTELSKFEIGWKFKSMYKYKDCLGI